MISYVIYGNVTQEVINYNLGNYLWSKIKNKGEEPLARYGHTSVTYKTKLMIYGGATPFDPLKFREDILVFDTGNISII
jgi:hypothetical protein